MILVFLVLSKLQILREIMEEERAKIRYELEQKQAEEDRKREAAQQASVLRDQMEKLKLREKEASGSFVKLKIFKFIKLKLHGNTYYNGQILEVILVSPTKIVAIHFLLSGLVGGGMVMANLTNQKGEFALAIFSPLSPPPPPGLVQEQGGSPAD